MYLLPRHNYETWVGPKMAFNFEALPACMDFAIEFSKWVLCTQPSLKEIVSAGHQPISKSRILP
jgi:hypothetical protein